jgi:protein SPT2
VPLKSKQTLDNSGRRVHGSREERKTISMNGHLYPKAGSNKLTSASKPNSASVDSKKQFGSNNGNGPGRPVGPKGLPLKKPIATMEKKASASGVKNSIPGVQKKPLPSKLHQSISKPRLEQKKVLQEPKKSRMMPKQPMASSKPQVCAYSFHMHSCTPLLYPDSFLRNYRLQLFVKIHNVYSLS